jgi:cell division septation protein DedD
MSKLLQRVRYWFMSKKTVSRRIAQVCASSLREIGLSVGGNVFELKNSKNRNGWLVSLQVPAQLQVPPVDTLALRLFLTRRIELALGMRPKSLDLVLSFSSEAKRLPFAESVIEPRWLKERMTSFLANVNKTASPAAGKNAAQAPAATKAKPGPPHPARTVAEKAKLVPTTSDKKASSAPPITLDEKMKALLDSLDDDDLYEVKEASMTDFDRAML